MPQTKSDRSSLSRRLFASTLAGAASVQALFSQTRTPRAPQGAPPAQATDAIPQNTSVPKPKGLPPETPFFAESLSFARKDAPRSVHPFPLTATRLLPSPFFDAQQANRAYLSRLDADRLLHMFRVNAGLSSSAEPLGGWEKPDCELRGHFVGHYLSGCALMYASTGDDTLKNKANYLVAELAKCQHASNAGGYLSAFPLEFFDRLDALQKVWAPFYTIHKIMAGLLDVSQLCGNRQALDVVSGMADWADKWSGSKTEPHMQQILDTEYGGMNEVLYNLYLVTGNERYVAAGDRFTKKKFFNPLAAHRDELRGLHVNTHIPQIIGAARRYEISSESRFHDVADYFWYEVTTARAYVTGGTSNNEGWLVEPRRLAEELKRGVNTTECCCAYNMLKLTEALYTWTADPRAFDYYERTLYNHRLAAIEPGTGHTQYYLSLSPAAWKTFNTETDSFWCCTGTGVEEFSKLNGNIYHHDDTGVFVNLFIPSTLDWQEKGLRLRQETHFPDTPSTTLHFEAAKPVNLAIRLRIPHWATAGVVVKVNGHISDATASPGSYLTLTRTWKKGDRIELEMPMSLRTELMPDAPSTQAVLYGPLVLAGDLGPTPQPADLVTGPMGPEAKKHPLPVPALRATNGHVDTWIKPTGQPLTFRTSGQAQDITFTPLSRTFGRRYSVYWDIA